METLAKPLKIVCQQLLHLNCPFKVILTKPDNKRFTLDPKNLYVIKHCVDSKGMHYLTATHKMGKEVL